MTNSFGVQNYLNTLIFCVVAKTVTIVLLALMVIEKVRYFAYLLLTVELGLILIIIGALFVISGYNKKLTKAQNEFAKSKIGSLNCPDYYLKINDEEGMSYCEDMYKTPDGKFAYKFSDSISSSNQTYFSKIPIETDFINKTVEEACQLASSKQYSDISWTSLKSKCTYQ